MKESKSKKAMLVAALGLILSGVPAMAQTFSWAGDVEADTNSVYVGTWMGDFYGDNETGWIYHFDLGWMYPSEASSTNAWFYGNTFSWSWTADGVYNWLYLTGTDDWAYYLGYLSEEPDATNWWWNQADEEWQAVPTQLPSAE